jgi:hypothetical protein
MLFLCSVSPAAGKNFHREAVSFTHGVIHQHIRREFIVSVVVEEGREQEVDNMI